MPQLSRRETERAKHGSDEVKWGSHDEMVDVPPASALGVLS